MERYVIYEIIGRKVGCCKNLKKRIRWYERIEGKAPKTIVLEIFYGKTDQEAGDREWYWADKRGYSRGKHYSVRNGLNTGIVGRIGARRLTEITTSKERSKWARKGGFRQKIQCPNCGKIGGLAPMKRWHFDNCQHKY